MTEKEMAPDSEKYLLGCKSLPAKQQRARQGGGGGRPDRMKSHPLGWMPTGAGLKWKKISV
jgi:hypothetical protein